MPLLLRAKCVLVGDSGVGKSAIAQSFHSDGTHFPKAYTMTKGVEICVKTVALPDSKDSVEMFIYDSAGKEIFADHVPQFWEHPSVVVVVYDVTNEQSFKSCAKWLERVRAQKPEQPFPGVLVANKTDLSARRVVGEAAGRNFAADKGLQYFECSAKDHLGIDTVLAYLAEEYHQLYEAKVEQIKAIV